MTVKRVGGVNMSVYQYATNKDYEENNIWTEQELLAK